MDRLAARFGLWFRPHNTGKFISALPRPVLQAPRFFLYTTISEPHHHGEKCSPSEEPSPTESHGGSAERGPDGSEDLEEEQEYKNPHTGEVGGPKGPEPTRFGDWEKGGRCYDF